MVLAIILIICLIAILGVSMTYFYGGSKSNYGNRLDGIEDVKITDSIKNKVIEELEKEEAIDKVSINNKGRMIYITINYVDGTTLDDAKVVADKAIPLFSEEELAYYDINLTIKGSGETKFTLMGARNSGGSGAIVWNNCTVVTTEE